MISVFFMLHLDFGVGWSLTCFATGRRVKVWGICSYSHVPRAPTCSHHLWQFDTVQAQQHGVLVIALSSSKVLSIHCTQRTIQKQRNYCYSWFKHRNIDERRGWFFNPLGCLLGQLLWTLLVIISLLQKLDCWISEGISKADYKLRASLPDTDILLISTDQKGTTVQTEVHDNLIAHWNMLLKN